MTNSIHYSDERSGREAIIALIGEGKRIGFFTWNRGHKNGKEAHIVTDNAIILIFNLNSKKLVTKLIARPGQLERYYGKGKVPTNLMAKAIEHQKLGYNKF